MAQFIRNAVLSILENNAVQSVISGLRISFKIEKSDDSDPNSSEIRIYNLTESTITKLKGEETSITLSVGYDGKNKKIFEGNDLTIESGFEGANKVTILKAGDGKKQLSETRVNMKLPEGSDLSAIVETLASKLKNIAFSNVQRIKLAGLGQAMTGGVLNGTVKETLDSILKPLNIAYSIQDSELKISTDTEVPTGTVVISPLSGLIGAPYKTKDGGKFKILLNPDIKPHGYVLVKTKNINGVYKVKELVHEGDTHSQDWFTEFEATTI